MSNIPASLKTSTLASKYNFVQNIGSGTYGEVILAREKNFSSNETEREEVAIKVMINNLTDKFQAKVINTEKLVLEKVKGTSPFIIEMKEFVKDRNASYFVLEYLEGGDLFGIIQKRSHLSEDAARFYASQVLLALEHLHEKDIVYRDLKPENVLLDSEGYIKLTDFGLSEIDVVAPNLTKVCGTPEYVAPEMLFEAGYGKQIDLWQFGVFIFEMITGRTPFSGNDQASTFRKIREEEAVYPISISAQLKSLLDGLFQKHPKKRLGSNGIDQLRKHPWFARTNWEALKKKHIKAPFIALINQKKKEVEYLAGDCDSSSSSNTSTSNHSHQSL